MGIIVLEKRNRKNLELKMLKTKLAILSLLFTFTLLGCGGGGGDETPTQPTSPGGQIYYPSGQTPPLNPSGSVLYPGAQPPQPPATPPEVPPVVPEGNFGEQIFPMVIDSQGNGTVTIKNFQPRQQLALILVNLNREYLDLDPPPEARGRWPLPDTSYSLVFDLVSRGVSSFEQRQLIDLSDPAYYSDILETDDYKGLPFDGKRKSLKDLQDWAHKDWVAQGGWDTRAPLKTASVLSKGEVRTFTEVPRTIPLPPIQQGEQRRDDLDELRWPDEYYGQDGRLVAIGSKVYIFLTTEINNGFPDGVRFTERRLEQMAREFDTVIFPLVTEGLAPVLGYKNEGPGVNQGPIWKNIDRNLVLTGDDFDNEGNLLGDLPGEPDIAIGRDKRIVVAIMNMDTLGAAGFYVNWQRGIFRPEEEEEGQEESYAWSTLYISPDIFPQDSDDWSQPYAVLAHEFQHKIYADHGVLDRTWLNESLSQLAVYLAGYTVESGETAELLIDQIVAFLNQKSVTPVPLNGEEFLVDVFASYGGRFLFSLYLYEHYGPSAIRKLYTLDAPNAVSLIEQATGEKFDVIFTRWALANFVDGLYIDEGSPLSRNIENNDPSTGNPWLHYLTFDIRGAIGGDPNRRLPGMPILWLPTETDVYPVSRSQITLKPWTADYVVIGNGDGRDLDLTVLSDPNFRLFLLPVTFNTDNNTGVIMPGVNIPRE